jgi:hypothetical protein
MLRSWLVLLLLTNYLLVVGAGLVNRPEALRYTAAHPYVHSAKCQQQYYLQLDCFDRCNGDQQVGQKRTAGENAQHLLSVSKGVDAHCLTEEATALPAARFLLVKTLASELAQSIPAGVQATVYAPPRWG